MNGASRLDTTYFIGMSLRGGAVIQWLWSAMNFGSSCPGSSPGRVIALCSWPRYFSLALPLATRVFRFKRVIPANLMLEGDPGMD